MRRLACLVVLLAATAHADPDAGLPDAGADAGEGRPGSSERVRELGFELVGLLGVRAKRLLDRGELPEQRVGPALVADAVAYPRGLGFAGLAERVA